MTAMSFKTYVRERSRLNEARRFVRFVQRIPPADLLSPRLVRGALRVRRDSMLDYPRLASLYRLAATAPPGALVECGSCNGGSAAMMAIAAAGRDVWLFDSWEGLPEPGSDDVAVTGKRRAAGANLGHLDRVERLLFKKLHLDPRRVHLIEGWFQETLPATRTGAIGLLHVDADWYESVRYVLESMYDRVAVGGAVQIDDYGHWLGCKRAVDEFANARALDLCEIDGGEAVYLIKP